MPRELVIVNSEQCVIVILWLGRHISLSFVHLIDLRWVVHKLSLEMPKLRVVCIMWWTIVKKPQVNISERNVEDTEKKEKESEVCRVWYLENRHRHNAATRHFVCLKNHFAIRLVEDEFHAWIIVVGGAESLFVVIAIHHQIVVGSG